MVSLIWATFIIYLRLFTILLWSCYLFFTCFVEFSKRTTMPTGCKDEPWQFEGTYISFKMQISCWVRRKEGEIRLGQKFNDLYLNTPVSNPWRSGTNCSGIPYTNILNNKLRRNIYIKKHYYFAWHPVSFSFYKNIGFEIINTLKIFVIGANKN